MSKRSCLVALCLLVAAPSIGVAAGMIIAPEGFAGKAVFFGSKVWLFALPVFWHIFVDRQKISISKPHRGGFMVSAVLGVLMTLFIFSGYAAFGKMLIDPQLIKNMASETGLANGYVYLAGAAYWILINSVLEEYVWRWFVVSRCTALMSNRMAIVVSAFAFTLHHIVAMQVYFSWFVTIVASLGIFIGGVVWSWCYIKYRSIWPCYLSHAIVDIAVFIVGYHLIFH